jgi:rRNA maturation protein Nop10
MEEDYIKEKCPVCGGLVLPTIEGWECDNRMNAVTPCPFSVEKQINGATITEDIVRELCLNGRSRILTMNDKSGKQYLAHLEVQNGKVEVVEEGLYLAHRCPHCGGRIRITSKGYYCENSLGKHPACKFHCNGILSHRFITPDELEAYFDGHPTIIDGCFNSQGRIFSAILMENESYGMSLTSVVGKCPLCGDDVLVSPVAFNCCNHHQVGEPYHMSVWRHVKGHDVTLEELKEILTYGITSYPVILNSENGSLSKAYLRLSEDKTHIVPDFNVRDEDVV